VSETNPMVMMIELATLKVRLPMITLES
jgi:hypothetical protein